MTELKAETKQDVPAAKKVEEPVIGDQGTAPPALSPITNRADHNTALAATRGIKAPDLPTISVLPADVPAQFADQARSLADRTAFANTMNRDTDVQAVFAPRPKGGTDYFEKLTAKTIRAFSTTAPTARLPGPVCKPIWMRTIIPANSKPSRRL